MAAALELPVDRPLSAFEERLKAWLGGVERRFEANLSANDTLELVMLDVIGEDWWTGGGITSKRVQEKLSAYPKAKTVKVLLNSGGGDAFEGLAIQSLLRRHGARIEVEVVGLAASAASIIAMAGDSIVMHEGALMMVHEPWTCSCGDAAEMRTTAEFLDKVNESGLDVYVRRTGRTREEIAALVAAETWMTAHEAVKEKFATSVVEGAAPPEGEPAAKARAAARVFMSARPAPRQEPTNPAPRQQELPLNQPPSTGGKEPGIPGKETNTMDLKVLAKMLGIAETATEAEVTAELNKRLTAQASVTVSGVSLLGVATEAEATAKIQEFQRGILQLLGGTAKATVPEAMGVVLEWKGKADQTDALTKQVAGLTEESRVAKRDGAIEKLTREGVLPPARHEWARAQFQTADAVETFCAGMPKGFFNAINEPTNDDASVALTADEKNICKVLGMSEAKYQEEKKLLRKAG